MTAYLIGIEEFLPAEVRTNDDLVAMNPGWDSDKIFAKTGIRARHIAGKNETSSDLGFNAADKLLTSLQFDRTRIDAILFCTQTPDYLLPSSACLLQTRLGLPTKCAALDFSLGCSGFVYGLWLAHALVKSNSAKNVLVVVGETYTKICNPHDLVTATIFGDAGGAALVSSDPTNAIASFDLFQMGTDGRGEEHLIVRAGGARHPRSLESSIESSDDKGNLRSQEQLFMNGPEVFNFTIVNVSAGIQELLDVAGLAWDNVDLFLFHQANAFMLEQLRRQMKIPSHKLPVSLEMSGNTVSASIPLLLRHCQRDQLIKPGFRTVLAGFGVGYSWGFCLLEWH